MFGKGVFMIKLQDFAKECGVTDRAIQKHLKNYAEELEGLYERKGPNGTWLSEEACNILRSKMKQQPIVVGDAESGRKIEELQEENRKLLMALNKAKDRIIELQGVQGKLDAAEAEKKLAITEAISEANRLAEIEKAEAVEAARRAKDEEFEPVRQEFEAARQELERPIKFREWLKTKGRKG